MNEITSTNLLCLFRRIGKYRKRINQRPWVNFTNVLQAAFTRADPKSVIKLLNLTVFFALLGSGRVEAAHRTLVKLTPGGKKCLKIPPVSDLLLQKLRQSSQPEKSHPFRNDAEDPDENDISAINYVKVIQKRDFLLDQSESENFSLSKAGILKQKM